ncbi:MAG: hypothetical protein ABEJ66_02130, partial [Candidatus Nanohaloarchaea archaeon]
MATVKDVVEGSEEVDHDEFREELEQQDEQLGFMREVSEGEAGDGELSGVPFVVKDAICTENVTTSAGSEM